MQSPCNRRLSLDDRRPRKLSEIVGQDHIKPRLAMAARNGSLNNRFAFVGPTGSGKTTLMEVTARMFYCKNSRELGDACGECDTCRRNDLSSIGSYYAWTGADLTQNWGWSDQLWSLFAKRHGCFALDESQDLSAIHQKAMLRHLESASALVLMATTHEDKINDALWGRFGLNKFHVQRPTCQQAVDYMRGLCRRAGVTANYQQLTCVAQHFHENLRLCVDFVYTAQDQAPGRIVTGEFLHATLGVVEGKEQKTESRRAEL